MCPGCKGKECQNSEIYPPSSSGSPRHPNHLSKGLHLSPCQHIPQRHVALRILGEDVAPIVHHLQGGGAEGG